MTISEMLKVIYSKLGITCEKCSEFGKIEAFIKRCGKNPNGCLINDCLTSLEPHFGITRDNLLYSNFFEKLIANLDTIKDKITVIDDDIYFEGEKVSGNPAVFQSTGTLPLHITASWTPTQEGSGDPSLDNIRPITRRNSVLITRQEDGLSKTLTLPETICGGTVGNDGVGVKEWHLNTLTGKETWLDFPSEYYITFSSGQNIADRTGEGYCSHLKYSDPDGVENPGNGIIYIYKQSGAYSSLTEFKAFLAEQYAAGTPVQVAYRLAKPIAFTATGGMAINALEGTNTVITDADNLEVIGRISQT